MSLVGPHTHMAVSAQEQVGHWGALEDGACLVASRLEACSSVMWGGGGGVAHSKGLWVHRGGGLPAER